MDIKIAYLKEHPDAIPALAQISTTSLLIGSIAIIPLILALSGRTVVVVCTLVDLLLSVALAILRISVHARGLLSIAGCLATCWNRVRAVGLALCCV